MQSYGAVLACHGKIRVRRIGNDFDFGFLANPDYIPYEVTEDGEMVLYDYTMEVGDSYRHVDGYDDVCVTSKDMVMLKDGKEHVRLKLSNGLELIEGLGCINSKGMQMCYLNPSADAMINEYVTQYLSASLTWADINNNLIYGERGPVKNAINTVTDNSSSSITLYDLQGRRLADRPRKGVYIRDGRKYVGK